MWSGERGAGSGVHVRVVQRLASHLSAASSSVGCTEAPAPTPRASKHPAGCGVTGALNPSHGPDGQPGPGPAAPPTLHLCRPGPASGHRPGTPPARTHTVPLSVTPAPCDPRPALYDPPAQYDPQFRMPHRSVYPPCPCSAHGLERRGGLRPPPSPPPPPGSGSAQGHAASCTVHLSMAA